MNNLGFSVKAIRKASKHLTEEPVFRGISLITPLPMGEGLGEGPVGPFLILNHTLSDCCSVATL